MQANQERSSAETVRQQNIYIASIGPSLQLIDAMPCLGAVLNEHRQVVYANQALLKFFGVKTMDDSLGKKHGELFACKNSKNGCGGAIECNYCNAIHTLLKAQASHKVEQSDYHITSVVKGQHISYEFEIMCTPFALNGQETYTIMALTDISAKKRRDMLEHTFLHDLGNQVSNLMGLSVLFKHADALGKLGQLTEILAMVSSAINDEILSYRQLINAESNTLSLQIEEVTAYNMIYNAIQFVKYNANLQNKEVVMKPPFPDINIKTDIALLQRTLLNMLKNALEASPEQPVVIGYYADDKTVTFWVNNPTVMSDMVKSRVFQRSFSTKGADRGIGTYSMKLLTERYLQGEVTFESKEGEGTTFRAAIPLRIE